MTINPRVLSLGGITADKIYDGEIMAYLNMDGAVLVNTVSGDNVNLFFTDITDIEGSFSDKNVAVSF